MDKQQMKKLLVLADKIDENEDILELDKFAQNCYTVKTETNDLMVGNVEDLKNYYLSTVESHAIFNFPSSYLADTFGLLEDMFSKDFLESHVFDSEGVEQICKATNKNWKEIIEDYYGDNIEFALSSSPYDSDFLDNQMLAFPI